MKSYTTFFALLAAAQAVIAQNFQINTPTGVASCQPTRFTWTGGQPPYILTLTEGTTTGGTLLKEFDGLTGDGFTWNVDVPGGTNFILNLKDSTGTIAQSAAVSVGDGGSGCLNTVINEGTSGQGSATSAPGGNSTSAGGTTPSATSPSSSALVTSSAPASTPTTGGSSLSSPAATSSSRPATSSASATTGGAAAQSSGAAQQLTAGAVGFTGLMGILGAMLF